MRSRATMRHQRNRSRKGNAFVELALAIPLLMALSAGSVTVGLNLDRVLQMKHVVRFAANLYQQRADFTDRAVRSMVLRSADGMGLSLESGRGVIYVSRIELATSGLNRGRAIVTHRHRIGDPMNGRSRIGTPGRVAADGHVLDCQNDRSAEAVLPEGLALRPGDSLNLAEFLYDPRDLRYEGLFSLGVSYVYAYF